MILMLVLFFENFSACACAYMYDSYQELSEVPRVYDRLVLMVCSKSI
jgi:hypothetical protein